MTAYYLPSMLTGDTVMLTASPSSEEYVAIDTEKLASYGFKKAWLDGTPIAIVGPVAHNNELYLQLYKNTRQQKWLEKIDTGKLLVPIAFRPGEQPKKLFRKIDDKLYTLAFLKREDFASFDTEGKYKDYKLMQADRTEHYVVNGVVLQEYKF